MRDEGGAAGARERDAPTIVHNATGLSYASYAEAVVKGRARIKRFLDADLFADPARDILLAVFAAEERGRTVSLTDCEHIAGIPATTTQRWVRTLVARGLLDRIEDPQDRRRTLLRLTARSRLAMLDYLEHVSPIPLRR
ncbi:MAG: winged helix DNA-binding protein [Sphingomonas paucimobilis]